MKKRSHAINTFWTVILTILSLAWVYPVVVVLINSFKKDSAISTNTAFQLPPADGFAGLGNYANAIHSKGFLAAFFNSFIISVTSVVLILVCCSMCAWFITRVKTWATKLCYFLFVFSMVVPFQMLMFTLANLADKTKLNTPFNICIIYLGFGAGLAVFMFTGFVKSIPLEIEEAAMIDGCGPLRTFFLVVMPMLKPTLVSVGILETMERLSAAQPGAGYQPVPHHPHPHSVPQGQLWHRGHGRHHGPDHAEHPAGDHLLSVLPEAHHQGRGGRRRQGLNTQHAGGGLIARARIFWPGPSG